MNILFVYPTMLHPERGGIERVSDLLAKEFTRRGHQCFYLHAIREEALMNYPYPAQLAFFPDSTRGLTEANGIFYHDYIIKHQIDIVINPHFAPDLKCSDYSDLCRYSQDIRQVSTICVVHWNPVLSYRCIFNHTMFWWEQTRWQKIKGVARLLKVPFRIHTYRKELRQKYENCMACTDRLCLLSDRYIPELAGLLPLPQGKVTAINNPNTYPQQPVESYTKKKQLLYVGRLEWLQKRTDRLVKIWKRLYKQFPDWELVIVGGGPLKPYLENEARTLERVRLVGYQNPEPYYKEASLLCLPSDYEGFGMVLTEAMTFGTIPVVFNSYAAAEDIIQDGENGILVPPFSIDRFTRVLETLMNNEEKREKMSQACRLSVRKFDIRHIGDEWEKLFAELKRNANR